MQWTAGTLSGATHHFLSPQNQIPWAMPWQTSSNPPGSRRKLLLKPPPLAAALIPAGCWQDTQVWEPASLPGLAWKLRALITLVLRQPEPALLEVFWLCLGLMLNTVQCRNKKKKKKKRTHAYCPKRSNSALPEHTFWGQGGRGPSCYLRPVMLKHSQRH